MNLSKNIFQIIINVSFVTQLISVILYHMSTEIIIHLEIKKNNGLSIEELNANLLLKDVIIVNL